MARLPYANDVYLASVNGDEREGTFSETRRLKVVYFNNLGK